MKISYQPHLSPFHPIKKQVNAEHKIFPQSRNDLYSTSYLDCEVFPSLFIYLFFGSDYIFTGELQTPVPFPQPCIMIKIKKWTLAPYSDLIWISWFSTNFLFLPVHITLNLVHESPLGYDYICLSLSMSFMIPTVFFVVCFGPSHVPRQILVPQPGSKLPSPALVVLSLNHWATREVPWSL